MKRIYKYAAPYPGAEATLAVPKGAEIVHMGELAPNYLAFWAIIDPFEDLEYRTFKVVGTGHDCPKNFKHLGTVITDDGEYVWHLLEVFD